MSNVAELLAKQWPALLPGASAVIAAQASVECSAAPSSVVGDLLLSQSRLLWVEAACNGRRLQHSPGASEQPRRIMCMRIPEDIATVELSTGMIITHSKIFVDARRCNMSHALHAEGGRTSGIVAAQAAPSPGTAWICHVCDGENSATLRAAAKCTACGCMFRDAMASRPCAACTFVNKGAALTCEMCAGSLAFRDEQSAPPGVTTGDAARGDLAHAGRGGHGPRRITFTFTAGGGRNVFKVLDELSRLPASVAAAPDASDSIKAAADGRAGGLAGILKVQENLQQVSYGEIEGAFRSLELLMVKASEMVAVADGLRNKLRERGDRDRAASPESREADELQLSLERVGIVAPVTKESSKSAYHVDLAKELMLFAAHFVAQQGGIMTLTDIFCLYNRARGISLISPTDLLHAASHLADLPASTMQLKEYPSGLKTVQLKEFASEALIAQKVRALLDPTPAAAAVPGASPSSPLAASLTQAAVARALKVSNQLALEFLLVSERQGLTCRDECAEGLRFFVNRFVQ